MTAVAERHELGLDVFGGRAAVIVEHREETVAAAALELAAARLRKWHRLLTRFEPGSELSRLNRDPRAVVPASPLLLDFAHAVAWAGALSGGLVDATQLRALERAGYGVSFERLAPAGTPQRRPPPRPAAPDPHRRWARVRSDRGRRVVHRPAGVRLDSGGLAKGLAADDVVALLAHLDRVAVDCSGDLRLGGRRAATRRVAVADPLAAGTLAELEVPGTWGVATSGVTRRSWSTLGGAANHLVDPATGAPAWTGVLQATALAPTALEAEVRAKAALLAGPIDGSGHLAHGGVLVLEDRTVQIVSVRNRSGERAGIARAA